MSKRYQGGFVSATRPTTAGGSTGVGSAPGIWEMETVGRAVASGAWPLAGNWIDDVFSSTLYTGTGASDQVVTTGINLPSKGGMVWTKARNTAYNHGVFDTVRGAANILWTDLTNAQQNLSNSLQSFTSTGFTVGGYASTGASSTYVAWTFRDQPKFFDVVTFSTGAATNNNLRVSHNLGSVPGCMILKRTDGAGDWVVWHRSLASATNSLLNLNTTSAVTTRTNAWGTSGPTSTDFGIDTLYFGSNATYVAYIFAHDAGGFGATGNENVISCGSFTTDASGNATVTLGYEPQWVLTKCTTFAKQWMQSDIMRGMPNAGQGFSLSPNTSAVENQTDVPKPNQTGFTAYDTPSQTYIYIAIRRPMKPPTTGTSVYYGLSRAGTSAAATVSGSPFPVDLAIIKNRFNNDGMPSNGFFFDRLRGSLNGLVSNTTDAQASYPGSLTGFDVQNGYTVGNETSGWVNYAGASNGALYMNWMFRRAPGFLDFVAYTGTGVNTAITHGLGVTPELIITKCRNTTSDWVVYAAPLGAGNWLRLNTTAVVGTSTTVWANTAPTSTQFSVGTSTSNNNNGSTYIAYLFASVPGVSQVGTYTGTGATLNINCGFTTGARFVLIKRTNATGAWYVFDTTRGIVAGNEVYMMLNDTGRDVSADWIAPLASGFQLTSGGSATVNVNGGIYIFLAIA